MCSGEAACIVRINVTFEFQYLFQAILGVSFYDSHNGRAAYTKSCHALFIGLHGRMVFIHGQKVAASVCNGWEESFFKRIPFNLLAPDKIIVKT